MSYFFVSLIIVGALCMVEGKLKNLGSSTFVNALKNDFNLVTLICISFSFASFMIFVMILFNNFGLLNIGNGEFNFDILPYIIYTITIVPLSEEYVYRFIPFRFFNDRKNFIIVSVISSMLFSMVHRANLIKYLFLFFMAFMLCVMYLKTKNISYTIGSHSVYNLFVHLNYYFSFNSLVFFLIIFLCSVSILFYRYRKNKSG